MSSTHTFFWKCRNLVCFFLLNILQSLIYKSVLIKVIITIEHIQHSSFVLGKPHTFYFYCLFLNCWNWDGRLSRDLSKAMCFPHDPLQLSPKLLRSAVARKLGVVVDSPEGRRSFLSMQSMQLCHSMPLGGWVLSGTISVS